MSNCEKCINHDGKDIPQTIPYIVHEGAMDRAERNTRRWVVAFFVALAMLFASNIAWIVYESQFETVSYDQYGEGINSVNLGEQGDLIYESESPIQEEEERQG